MLGLAEREDAAGHVGGSELLSGLVGELQNVASAIPIPEASERLGLSASQTVQRTSARHVLKTVSGQVERLGIPALKPGDQALGAVHPRPQSVVAGVGGADMACLGLGRRGVGMAEVQAGVGVDARE